MAERRIPPYMQTLGERVHVLRRRLRLSQAELARQAGMSPTTLSNIEQAKMPTITVEHLMALAEVLGTSPNRLLGVELLTGGMENEQNGELLAAGMGLVGA
jgi:transcriptional regulator with XRE-family HTH domain